MCDSILSNDPLPSSMRLPLGTIFPMYTCDEFFFEVGSDGHKQKSTGHLFLGSRLSTKISSVTK